MPQLSEALRIDISAIGRDVCLHLVGVVDLASCDVLRVALDACIREGAGDVRVDMSATSFCDSVGLCTLLAARQQLGASARRLRVVDPSPAVSRLLDLSGTRALLDDPVRTPRRDATSDGGPRRIPAR